jgi:hypothetical protein
MRWRDFIALVGGAAAWPVAGRAQQTALPVIEYLNGESADLPSDHVRGFRQGPEGNWLSRGPQRGDRQDPAGRISVPPNSW